MGLRHWLAYSLIPYKTPWLMLSFTVPMAIAGGHAVQLAYDWSRRAKVLRALTVGMLGFALAACVYQTAVLNFLEYDNDQYPYVYAHTRREYVQMMREVERLSERAGTGKKTAIAIATPDYWPMPWYLRDNSGVAYDQNVLPSYDANKTPIVIGKDDEKLPKLRSTLGTAYRQVGNALPAAPRRQPRPLRPRRLGGALTSFPEGTHSRHPFRVRALVHSIYVDRLKPRLRAPSS